jgi:hypothetical protein
MKAMKKEELKKLAEEIVGSLMETAKASLKRDGELVPVAFLLTPKGLLLLPMEFKNPAQKHDAVALVGVAAELFNAVVVFMLTEAWFVQVPEGVNPEDRPRPSESKNRREMISCAFKARDFEGVATQEFRKVPGGIEFVEEVKIVDTVKNYLLEPLLSERAH